MKLTISTEVLKRLVSKAMKGVREDKTKPLTSLICLRLENDILTAITTDGTNYLYTKESCKGSDFYTVVGAERFSKLVSKLTCETTELKVTKNALEVNGNGKYKIEIPLDEGEPIAYPDPVAELELGDAVRVNRSDIKAILSSCKFSLATGEGVPCYKGYYVGESVTTTNNHVMSSLHINLLGTTALISPRMMDLVNVGTAKTLLTYILEDMVVWESSDCVVYGPFMEGVEDYPIEGIKNYINQKMDSCCAVDKKTLLDALDRITLFVNEDVIKMTFTDEGLRIESDQSASVETVPYLETMNFEPFSQSIDVSEFIKVVKVYPIDSVELQYGSERALKLDAGNLIFVIAWGCKTD